MIGKTRGVTRGIDTWLSHGRHLNAIPVNPPNQSEPVTSMLPIYPILLVSIPNSSLLLRKLLTSTLIPWKVG